MDFFEYGEKEITYLKNKCPKMAKVIDRTGNLQRELEPKLFKALVSSIVSQQISIKAAATVFSRLEELVKEITYDNILSKTDDEIKACGLSYRKVGYLKGLCEAVSNGDLALEKLPCMTDEEIISELVKLNGIGVWSAEMFLIHSLRRADILSYGDLVIRKGIMKLHGLEKISAKEFQEYKKLYSPYGSIAAFYLWHLAHEEQEKC